MAAKSHSSSSSTSNPNRTRFIASTLRSPIILLLTISFLVLLILHFFLTPLNVVVSRTNPLVSNNIETSFVTSLEHFLAAKSRPPSRRNDDTVSGPASDGDVMKLDDEIWKRENERVYGKDLYYPVSPLRVYVYEMPDKFTYDLLWLFRNSYKETFNLTSNGSPVHRLIEQDLRGPVPGNTVVTVTASHGIEVVHEFKPIEHPAEPLNNDLPIQCPLSEPSILNDGRIWKERVTAGMRLRAELPVTQVETAPPGPETGDKKLLPFQQNRLIMPSLSAPEHDILNLLEEINASGTRKISE